ncbi:hypothetical protein BJ944DRAFT_262579 [Cunninghamella echinulata]|nr:hypothetical protein BJ944DRAFT_262579 [Cunninghamella echinulata]
MSKIQFYDLILDTENELWSPNTLKTRIALNLKNIPYDNHFLTFPQIHETIPKITKNGKRPTVPVIVDRGNVIQDSWEIAKYLDATYPNTPSLFNGDEGINYFFYQYCNHNLLTHIFKLCVLYIHKKCHDQATRDWFRKDRERLFKVTLEQFAGEEATNINAIKNGLKFIHITLKTYPYLTGNRPGFADVTLAAYFQNLRVIRPDLFESTLLNAYPDQAIRNWWNKMEKYTKLAPPNTANL